MIVLNDLAVLKVAVAAVVTAMILFQINNLLLQRKAMMYLDH